MAQDALMPGAREPNPEGSWPESVLHEGDRGRRSREVPGVGTMAGQRGRIPIKRKTACGSHESAGGTSPKDGKPPNLRTSRSRIGVRSAIPRKAT